MNENQRRLRDAHCYGALGCVCVCVLVMHSRKSVFLCVDRVYMSGCTVVVSVGANLFANNGNDRPPENNLTFDRPFSC